MTLEDFLDQMQQVRKMGPMSQVLGMIPGFRNAAKGRDLHVDDGQINRVEAIIRSMTLQERRHPEIINGSRRRRIASGSGTSVQEVNQLLSQFKQMRKLMKQMGRGGLPGLLGPNPEYEGARMVKIRLARVGGKKNAIYRVVVADVRSPRDGRNIETIGRYNPQTHPSIVEIDVEKADNWIANGAQPTSAVQEADQDRHEGSAARPRPPDAGRRMSPADPSPLSAMIGALARGLVDNPEQVEVNEESDGETRVISLYVAETDLGQVIGRGGRVARALRVILRVGVHGPRRARHPRDRRLDDDPAHELLDGRDRAHRPPARHRRGGPLAGLRPDPPDHRRSARRWRCARARGSRGA